MEELDLLKKDWNKDGNRYPEVSENDIYAMLHKKSSSIIKWILFISIIEFIVFLIPTILLSDNADIKRMEVSVTGFVITALYAVDYIIMAYFFYKFYINYKKITSTDNVNNLMVNIINTRKTVSTYIFVKVSYMIVLAIITFIFMYNNDPLWLSALHSAEESGNGPKATAVYIIVALLAITALAFFLWLFYRLIYGFLLKRLKRNYDELKKIDF